MRINFVCIEYILLWLLFYVVIYFHVFEDFMHHVILLFNCSFIPCEFIIYYLL